MNALDEARAGVAEVRRQERAVQEFLAALTLYKALVLKGKIMDAWREGRIPDDRAELLIQQFGLENVEALAAEAA